MRFRRHFIVILSILLVISGAAAFDGTGSGAEETQCTDGIDNDGDDEVDGDDPACTQPYYLDDSEFGVYDTAASYVFNSESGDFSIDSTPGPSLFFGSQLRQLAENNEFNLMTEDTVEEGGYLQYYMDRSTEAWGGIEDDRHNISLEDIESRDGWQVVEHPENAQAVTMPPHPEADGDLSCGDGNQNYGDISSCPEDYGLTANSYGADIEHDIQSSNTVSDILQRPDDPYVFGDEAPGSGWEKEIPNIDRSHDDLEARTLVQSKIDEDPEGIRDISNCDGGCNRRDFSGRDYGEWNSPDFIVSDRTTIFGVYAIPEGGSSRPFGTVETEYVGPEETVDDYDTSGNTLQDTCDHSLCEEDSLVEDVCTSVNEGVNIDHYVEDGTSTTTIETSHDVIRNDVWSFNEGYEEDDFISDVTAEIEYQEVTNEGKTYNACESRNDIQEYQCGSSDSENDQEAAMEEEQCAQSLDDTDYPRFNDEISHNPTSDTDTVNFYYDEITRVEQDIFSLDPIVNSETVSDVSVREGLFYGDEFKGETYQGEPDDGSSAGGKINYVYRNNNFYAGYNIPEPEDFHFSNSHGLTATRLELRAVLNEDDFGTRANLKENYNIDGEYGFSDGFVSIEHDIENENERDEAKGSDYTVTGTTDNLVRSDSVTIDGIESRLKNQGVECPGDYIRCIASIDMALENLNNWNIIPTTTDAISPEYSVDVKGPHQTSESLSTCRMYEDMTDTDIDCLYEFEDEENDDTGPQDPTGGNGGDNGDAECDTNRAGNWNHQMEGPAVNEDLSGQYPSSYNGCITEYDSCVLHGDEVKEGHVGKVASDQADAEFEAGGDSPDWKVCLNIQDNGPGGEFYDLDSEQPNNYLDSDHELVVNEHIGGVNDITYYWQSNEGPQHPEYNPRGGEEGLAIENNCGNPRYDGIGGQNQDNQNLRCSNVGEDSSRLNSEGFTFSFYNDRLRDEDYHPQGEDVAVDDPFYEGYIVMLNDLSQQLEPGMDTGVYSMSDSTDDLTVEKWYSTLGDNDNADQFAIASHPSWSVDATGEPYPPWGSYYRDESLERTSALSGSVSKVDKTFGNSYAGVIGPGLAGQTDNNDNMMREGEGVWIDPDDLWWAWESQSSGEDNFIWPDNADQLIDVLSFRMDLTGPDSGIGLDRPGENYRFAENEFDGTQTIVTGDIIWETEDGGGVSEPFGTADHPVSSGTEPVTEIHDNLNPYVCGDDRSEFLIEEMGESVNSERFTGPYGCTTTPNTCLDGESMEFSDVGTYKQMNEPGESEGRPKNDIEYCGTNPNNLGVWYDQDFKQEACRENTLHGPLATRWVDEDYVRENPHAVTGGIDDSYNSYMSQHASSFDNYQRLESRPDKTSWSSSDFDTQTPVDTGTSWGFTASLGFCAGDDDGEHVITQTSNTDYVETDRDVVGVANSPKDCVLDNEQINYPSEDDERKLYNTGDEVDLMGGGTTIACFQGVWYQEWPVVFQEDNVEIELGESVTATYHVINVEETERTFEVTKFGDAEQFSDFINVDSSSFEVTLEPQSSQQFQVEIYGGDTEITDDNLWVQANAIDSPIDGEDSVVVSINEPSEGGTAQETRGVNGIGLIQVAVLLLMSMAMFYTQS